MTDDWSDKTTRKLVQIFNERGHAGAAAHNDNVLPGSKSALEAHWALEWMTAANEQLGLAVCDVEMNPSDPPDAFATIGGSRVSVELAELVDGGLIAGLKAHNRKPEYRGRRATSHNDPFFTAAQWVQDRFFEEVDRLIDKKHRTYAERELVFDYLVIYSAEPWLNSRDVGRWVAERAIARRRSLRNVHLLLDYVAGDPGGHPVFRVY